MSASIAVYGRLTGEPKAIDTKTGTRMAVATLAVDIGDDEVPTLWLGLACFGRLADDLLRHANGEPVSASGRLQVRRWAGPDGAQREQWQVVADALVSARTVRPGARKSRTPATAAPPFDDPLP